MGELIMAMRVDLFFMLAWWLFAAFVVTMVIVGAGMALSRYIWRKRHARR
jgi:hypothetical protein